MKYDLIIIGSGSVGAAAGYYATRAGLNVLMTDAHMPPHQHGSHHGDTRLIRHAYGEGEKYVPLVLRAQTLWDELSRHNEEDPIFERYGVISAAFHWLSAIIVYGMFALGLWMVTLSYYDGWYHKAPELHKSIGILLMMGLVIRVLWRVISPPPGPLRPVMSSVLS
jgi:hypothetical protein